MRNKVLFFEYVTQFLDIYLVKQAGKSINTVESYRDSLTVFRKFMLNERNTSIKNFYMLDCNKDLILSFVEHLRKQNRQTTTINHHVSAIKSYLWYVADINIEYEGIAIAVSHIPAFRTTKKEKECLDENALRLLFESPKNNIKGIRDRTIMILLYETAIRVGELLNIKVTDINLNTSQPFIFIHGKGDKDRIVGLSSKAIEHINYYMRVFHKNTNTDLLFYSTIKGITGKISESTVETFIQKYADDVRTEYEKIPKKVHPHMFRRSRATHLYQDGTPLELVSRMLGHSSMETTKIYAKPSIEMLRKAIENENDIDIESEFDDEDEIVKLYGLR